MKLPEIVASVAVITVLAAVEIAAGVALGIPPDLLCESGAEFFNETGRHLF